MRDDFILNIKPLYEMSSELDVKLFYKRLKNNEIPAPQALKDLTKKELHISESEDNNASINKLISQVKITNSFNRYYQ